MFDRPRLAISQVCLSYKFYLLRGTKLHTNISVVFNYFITSSTFTCVAEYVSAAESRDIEGA